MSGIGGARIFGNSPSGAGGVLGLDARFDAIVAPAGGDYALISDACDGEAAGALIGVAPGSYVENDDITLKDGQVVSAVHGFRDGDAVDVQMDDYRLLMPNDDNIVEGIYFNWANMTVAGNYMVVMSGRDSIMSRLTLDMQNTGSGLPVANQGVQISTVGESNHYFENINILLNDGSTDPLSIEAGGNYFNNVYVSGGDDGTHMTDCYNNTFINCTFRHGVGVLTIAFEEANTGGVSSYGHRFVNCVFDDLSNLGMAYYQELDGTQFTNCFFNGGPEGGIDINSSGVTIESCEFYDDGSWGIRINGTTKCNINNCTFECAGNSIEILSPAGNVPEYINISNCSARPGAVASAGNVLISGGQNIAITNVKFPNSGLTIQPFGVSNPDNIYMYGVIMGSLSVFGVGSDAVSEFGCVFPGGITDTSDALQRGVRSHIQDTNPTVNDDSSDGFIAGVSKWFDTSTGIEYLCHDSTVGAAVWVPIGSQDGKAMWDFLVHPTAGYGDYQLPSTACSSESQGDIIAIAPGEYDELNNIVMQEGQTLIALGGIEGDDFTAVTINFTDNQRIILDDDVRVKGIYFTCDRDVVTDDVKMMDFDECSRAVVEDCTFDCTPTSGTQQHQVFDINGINSCRMENITVIGDTETYTPFDGASDTGSVADSIFRNIKISGCKTTVNAGEQALIDLEDPERNTWDTVYHDHQGLASVQAGAMLRVTSTKDNAGCHYTNLFFLNDALAADGRGIEYSGSFRKPDALENIMIQGFYDGMYIGGPEGWKLDNFTLEGCGNKAFDSSSLDNATISNGYIRAAGTTGMEFTGRDSLVTNIQFDGTVGTHDLRILATANDNKFSNIYGDAEIEFNPGKGSGLSNFRCGTLDINVNETFIENGYVYSDMTIDADSCHISNVYVDGTCTVGSGSGSNQFTGCRFDELDITGGSSLFNLFSACYIANGTIGASGTVEDTCFSACRLQNYAISDAENTKIAGCIIDDTLTNGGSAIKTQIAGSTFGTFTDNGQDTERDVYTQETLGGAGPFSIRGSREYDNTGLGVGSTITLPDPAVVQVSVGYRFRVVVSAAQQITIAQPALQQIHINGASSTAGAGGNANSNAQWSVLELEYKGNNNWVAVAKLGTWNLV